jgi:predicted MPP superfamily phosphohydrolase
MPIAYVHISDIHFGQEKKGGQIVIHDDAKARLIDDVAAEVKKLPNGRADGIIVTGDIAYAGKGPEYTSAGEWLDKLAAAAGCKITDIQVVPGNHDIDLDNISPGTKLMLAGIIEKGEDELDLYLDSQQDRESLYTRFHAYRPFAEAYNCSLDCTGGLASDKIIELSTPAPRGAQGPIND